MGHGGVIEGPKKSKTQPFVFHCAKSDDNWGEVASNAWKTIGDRCKIPQLLMFTFTDKSLSPASPSNHHVHPPRQGRYHL
jgi:hypothetical protein